MPDARFASLKTDPRFRRPKKHHSKVVLDDRFKHLLEDDKKKKKKSARQTTARVDKYGRTVSSTQEKEDLRRFYRLEEEEDGAASSTVVDYARGVVLMESSDEEDRDLPSHVTSDDESDSDQGGFISLGPDSKNNLDDAEVDLDENAVADYEDPEQEQATDVKQTRRLAVVNLDWDYVRAVHLYKIFSSLVSPTAPLSSTLTSNTEKSMNKGGMNIARGRILSVRVYPSEFGKKRMAKEEDEGPPAELFKRDNAKIEDEEINEKTVFETGSEADYDEDALRKYQLERLRYYYAIVECDTVEATVHVYDELEGAELERSANVFDLSFVPDDMMFDDTPRDEVTQPSDAPYRAVEFVTDALRHSKVKLTWDEDDPERNQVLRRPLTKKEIDEADFRAYIASSSSSEGDSEDEGDGGLGSKDAEEARIKNVGKTSKKTERDKLRKLLLGGSGDELPEGWGNAFDNKTSGGDKGKTRGTEDSKVDMEVTFLPGLSESKNPEDENTLERYQRKMKEKRKRKKVEARKNGDGDDTPKKTTAKSSFDDEFFGIESDSQCEEVEVSINRPRKQPTKSEDSAEASKAELVLVAVSDNPHGEPAHFDMKAVLKAEKQAKHRKSGRRSRKHDWENEADDKLVETQDDFVINVKDDRFAAIHEDHQFAIDPTNPLFKKTKSMAALLDERSRRQKSDSRANQSAQPRAPTPQSGRSLQSLVESVKRKSAAVDRDGLGKRQRLGNN